MVEFETITITGRVCATALDIFTKSSYHPLRQYVAVVPWNTTDLTGRINTTGRVLSVTSEKGDASSRLIAVAWSERATMFASSCKQYAICSATRVRRYCWMHPFYSDNSSCEHIYTRRGARRSIFIRCSRTFAYTTMLSHDRVLLHDFLHDSTCILSMWMSSCCVTTRFGNRILRIVHIFCNFFIKITLED